jgi:hypothetical protein
MTTTGQTGAFKSRSTHRFLETVRMEVERSKRIDSSGAPCVRIVVVSNFLKKIKFEMRHENLYPVF